MHVGGLWGPYKAQPPEKILAWSKETQDELLRMRNIGWPVNDADVLAVAFQGKPPDLYFSVRLST